ncbi:MAG: NAD(P)H-dependent oxidoreductase subunit E, partial [Candidatus Eremiobacteraeota bacterium]|nr:NAD(P)H-dependent oxidoreductase subunit E [Candidatus Eremiobacteraeota bacterium]
MAAVPTAEEHAALDAALGNALPRRDLLLPALHAVNDRTGWISPGALNLICERLEVAPAEAYGVATFYAMFAMQARAKVQVHVCDDIACMANGAETLCAEMERSYGKAGTQAATERLTWQRSPCLGLCERGPAALVLESGSNPSGRAVAPATAADISGYTRNGASRPRIGGGPLRLLARAGKIDPHS